MKILITGGTGLIGRRLVTNLLDAGHEILVLTRDPQHVKQPQPGVHYVRWDGRSSQGWGHRVEGLDAIVNLAGEPISAGRWTASRRRRIRDSRMNAGHALVEAVTSATNKPRVLLQASAVGIYGPRGDELIDETDTPGSDFLSSVAADWEASTAAVESSGVRRVILRLGVVLSPDGGALPRMVLPFRFFAGGRLGSGRQHFPWIHLDDAVGAMRFLLEDENARGVFNLTAPHSPTNASFAMILGHVLKRPAWIPVPAFALRLLFGEMATVLLDGQNVAPRRLQASSFVYRHAELEPALRDLLNREAAA